MGKAAIILLITVVLAACAAKQQTPLQTLREKRKTDSLFYTSLLHRYDSAYNLYSSAKAENEAAMQLQKAGTYLDTIIRYRQEIITSGDSLSATLLAAALWNKGIDQNEMAVFTDAEKTLQQYFALGKTITGSSPVKLAYAHKIIGDIYTRFGDYTLAIYHKRKSIAYYSTINDVGNLSSEYINISIPFREASMYDSAIAYLTKGITLPGTAAKRLFTMHIELAKNFLAEQKNIHAKQELTTASDYYNEVATMPDEWERLADYKTTYAEELLAENDVARAIKEFKLALHFFLKKNNFSTRRQEGKLYNHLGKAYGKMKEQDSAIRYFNKALWCVTRIDANNIFATPSRNQLYAENTIIESLAQKANWMTNDAGMSDEKHLICAVDCYDNMLRVEYKLLQNFSYNNSKLLMLKESRRYSEKAIDACYRLYQANGNEEWVNKAFQFAERNKSYILLESVKRNLAASSLLQTDTIYRQLEEAQLVYTFREKELSELQNSNNADFLQQARQNLSVADEQLQFVKSTLRFSHSSYNAVLQNEDSISIASVKKTLPGSSTAMIEYFMGDSSAYGFFISTGKSCFHKLDNSLPASIDSFLYFFTAKNNISNDPYGYNKIAYNLYRNLQLNTLAGNVQKLIIIPDDRLGFVAFDALVSSPVATYNLSSLHYLVKQFEITYNYSATMLQMQQEYTRSVSNHVVAFAPVFANGERGLTNLQYSKEEINLIRENSTGNYFEDKEATIRNFKINTNTEGIIHIASHASSEGVPHIEFYDSTLYLDELYAMTIHANLVVLSGCETGLGKIEKSEGTISLARGFYFAGTHHVITSLWSVDDRSTSQIFGDFYKNLHNNNYSNALHDAEINYLATPVNNEKHSPYYWAGFVSIGYSKERFISTFLYPIFVSLIVVLVVIILYKKRGTISF